ncbi:hypothetical protein B6I21_04725 [candidate division KSB1 bacterium 4572_119]|nr:MAG: hypothetical protein B6I21_04725 [candidate division KSB1 bacterium 4572_119]
MYTIPLVVIYAIFSFLIFKQLSYIRLFKEKKITSSGNAKLLDDIKIQDSRFIKDLVNHGVLIQTKENKFHMDAAKSIEFGRKRRGLFYSITFFFVILFFFILNNF